MRVSRILLYGSLTCLILLHPGGRLLFSQVPQQPTTPDKCQEELQLVRGRLTRMDLEFKDWANFAYYREANSRLSEPGKNEIRVVFMGDSNTDFWDNPGYGGFFPGKPYVNRGITGQRTPQMLIRFRQDVLALRPRVVVILAGTNDIAGDIATTTFTTVENNLMTMSELARMHGIRVVLASLLPVSDYNKSREGKPLIRTIERPLTRINAINTWLREYAAENGFIYLDYFSALADEKGMLREALSNDGVHPNSTGFAIMAPLAEAAISRALKSKRG
jgi:lysophospholipase L1-like esterase